MYEPEVKLIPKAAETLKSRIPILSQWKIEEGKDLKGANVDVLISARYGKTAYHFCIEVKRAGYPQFIRDAVFNLQACRKVNPEYYPVVFVPLIGEQGKKICDKYEIGYMDLGGNMKISVGGIYVEREVKKGDKHDHVQPMQSIFSPKASRIARGFLSAPQEEFTQKTLVEKSGLSKGMVSRIVKRMLDAGYLREKDRKLKLSNFDDLLSAWVEEAVNRREIRKFYYVWAQNPMQLMRTVAGELSRKGVRYAFTQEAGASLVAPFATFDIVSVYVESLDLFPSGALSAEETAQGFNLVVIEPPDEAVFLSSRDIQGMKVVDNLQLYVDLRKNVLRGDKQAEHIMNIIRKELNG